MAGNTKLMGFGLDSTVQLERWGGKAMVKLDPMATAALRDACTHELPKKPPDAPARDLNVLYSERFGRVEVEVSPADAAILVSVLDRVLAQNLTESTGNLVRELREGLHYGVAAHEHYISQQDEPGLG